MEFTREHQWKFFDYSFNDEHNPFPFKHQVECAGAIEILFEEYLNTDKKASFRDFLDDNITKSEKEKGIWQNNLNIPESKSDVVVAAPFVKNSDYDRKVSNLFDKFNTSVLENSLNEKYFRHQINQTKTFEILDSVENRINVFKGQILTDSIFDPVETVDNFVSFLQIQLNKLELPVLKKKVLEYFVNDRENHIIDAECRANSLIGTKKPYGYKNSLITDYQLIKEAADRRILSLIKDSDSKLPVKDKDHHGLSLKELGLMYYYLDTNINKSNVDAILSLTNHTTPNKLIGAYNLYTQSSDRTNPEKPGAKSANTHNNRFKKVISRLTLIGNQNALEKAKKEHDDFLDKYI